MAGARRRARRRLLPDAHARRAAHDAGRPALRRRRRRRQGVPRGARSRSPSRQGIAEERIALDPGIGFGKTLEHNLELLRRLDEIVALGRPVVIGTSRKSFLGPASPAARTRTSACRGTIATNVLALERGATVFRVHDVAAGRAMRSRWRLLRCARDGADDDDELDDDELDDDGDEDDEGAADRASRSRSPASRSTPTTASARPSARSASGSSSTCASRSASATRRSPTASRTRSTTPRSARWSRSSPSSARTRRSSACARRSPTACSTTSTPRRCGSRRPSPSRRSRCRSRRSRSRSGARRRATADVTERIGYLGLGSNVGDRRANLQAAVDALPGARRRACWRRRRPTTPSRSARSSTSRTFLNACLRIETALEPEALLDACKAVERELGRDRPAASATAPRPIDVDLLLLGDTDVRAPSACACRTRRSQRGASCWSRCSSSTSSCARRTARGCPTAWRGCRSTRACAAPAGRSSSTVSAEPGEPASQSAGQAPRGIEPGCDGEEARACASAGRPVKNGRDVADRQQQAARGRDLQVGGVGLRAAEHAVGDPAVDAVEVARQAAQVGADRALGRAC